MADHKETARKLQALAEPTRLLVVRHLLRAKESCVGAIAEAVGTPMANLSRHLNHMKAAGLLVDRKDGKRRVYSLNPELFTPGGREGAPAALRVGFLRVAFPADADGVRSGPEAA